MRALPTLVRIVAALVLGTGLVLAAGGDQAKRAFAAMMDMKKIDVAAIETARRG